MAGLCSGLRDSLLWDLWSHVDLPEGQRAVGVPLAGDAHAPWSLLTWDRPRFRAEGRREGETPEGHKAHRKQTPQPPWGGGDFVLMHSGQEAPRTDCELLRKKREGSQGGLVSDISALLPWPGGPGRSLCLCC